MSGLVQRETAHNWFESLFDVKVEEAEKDTELWEKRATDVLENPDASLEPSATEIPDNGAPSSLLQASLLSDQLWIAAAYGGLGTDPHTSPLRIS